MASTSLNISLPSPLKKYVEAAAKAGDYSTPSEYVRELIREDKQRQMDAHLRLEQRLLKALEGPLYDITEEDLAAPDFIERLRKKEANKEYSRRPRLGKKG
jgi:antitoxin ParD1/3/4